MNHSLTLLLNYLCMHQRPSKVMAIDVGAHYGEFAKYLISTSFFQKVISFEPNPESYNNLLNQNLSTNDCKHYSVNLALSNYSGNFDLNSDNDTATASLLKYDSNYKKNGEIITHRVTAVTLDEYISTCPDLDRLQLLKIDTQGNDLSVIMGGVQTIEAQRPIIQTEFIYTPMYEGQCTPAELSDALISLGYEIYSLNNLHITDEGRLAFCDAIFIPKQLNVPVTQTYTCIDDQISYISQINTLAEICKDRLSLIELLDAEVQRLKQSKFKVGSLTKFIEKVRLWAQ